MKLTYLMLCCLVAMMCFNCQFDTSDTTNENGENTSTSSVQAAEDNSTDINIESKEDLFDALHTALDKVESEWNKAEDKLDEKNRVETTNYKDLQGELPLMISGMLRSDVQGELSGFGQFKVSVASAVYETDNRRMQLSITDTGNIPFAKLGYKWLGKADFVHESDEEYARSTTKDGFTAYEQYHAKDKAGSISVVVEDRFIVHVEGTGVSERNLSRAIEKVDLKALSRL
ncbi:MAG: hypothetical protein AAF847_18610 [Bacteroidota bacterium]